MTYLCKYISYVKSAKHKAKDENFVQGNKWKIVNYKGLLATQSLSKFQTI